MGIMFSIWNIELCMPDFFVGFDLVGQEDSEQILKKFAEKILALPENINFSLCWIGSIDENLVCTICLILICLAYILLQ